MSVIWNDSRVPLWLGPAPSFSFFEQAQIEIPAPIKYQHAQEYRVWLLRDKGPDWYLWNALMARKFYLRKREWWQTIV
jgi:hypothetical protein